jgi:hypothetical protein
MASAQPDRFATTFLRYWGANMDRFVWQQGYDWPGFGYGPEDRALLVRWGQTVGHSFLIFTLATVVLFLVLASAILAVVWGPILMSDPATASAVVFLAGLGAACIIAITVALPLAMLGAAWLASRFERPFAPTDDEVRAAHRVSRVVLGQIRRVGIIGGILVPIGSLLMLVSATFERVITLLGATIPWIIVGIGVLEGLIRVVPTHGSEPEHGTGQ